MHQIRALAAVDQIGAAVAEQGIRAGFTEDGIVSALAMCLVIAGSGVDRVVAAIRVRRRGEGQAIDDVFTGVSTTVRAVGKIRGGEDQAVEGTVRRDINARFMRAMRRDEGTLPDNLAIAISRPFTLLAAIALRVEEPADLGRGRSDSAREIDDDLFRQIEIRVMAELPWHRGRAGLAGDTDATVIDDQMVGRSLGKLTVDDLSTGDREARVRRRVVAGVDGDGLGRARDRVVGAAVTPEDIVAGAAGDEVITLGARRDVIARAGIQGIGPGATVQRIRAGSGIQAVIVAPTLETVIAVAGGERVIAGIAGQPVIAGAAIQGVVALVAPENVIALAADQGGVVIAVHMAGEIDHIVTGAAIDDLDAIQTLATEVKRDVIVAVGSGQCVNRAVGSAVMIVVVAGMTWIGRIEALGLSEAVLEGRVFRVADLIVGDTADLVSMELIEIAAVTAIQGIASRAAE